MGRFLRRNPKTLFVPEVIQTSMMDCGPAALNALLGGFGIYVSYGRLREACQTGVDGTSIDTLEELAVEFGLDAEQIMIPPEHVLMSDADTLPALAVVRLPGGLTHFVVAWNQWGDRVQIMDPASGRRWPTREEFLQDLFIHTMPVPAAAFYDFAQSDSFRHAVEKRLVQLGQPNDQAKNLFETALKASGWQPLAVLEAAVRMVESLVESRGLQRGNEAIRVVHTLYEAQVGAEQDELIPAHCYTARPAPPDADGEERVYLRGALLVRAKGLRESSSTDEPRHLAPEIAAALAEKPANPAREVWRLLRQDGLFAPSILLLSVVVATIGRVVELLLIRGLIRASTRFVLPEYRTGAIFAFIVFMAAMIAFDFFLATGFLRI